MADHALATITNPSSALTDFTLIVNLANMPAGWWSAVDTADGTKGRVFKGDGTTELASDWIDFDNGAETGLLRVKWSGTLASSGTQQLWIEPPKAANSSYAADDTYGSDNAYDEYWHAYYADGGITDRTVNGLDGSENGGVSSGGVAGVCGLATDYDGSNDYVEIADPFVEIFDDAAHTIVAFFSGDTRYNNHILVGYEDAGGTGDGDYWMQIMYNNTFTRRESTYDDDINKREIYASLTLTANVWYMFGGAQDPGSSLYYAIFNGSLATSGADNTGAYDAANSVYLGANVRGEWLNGKMQHVSFHTILRPNEWLAEEYSQITDNSTFWGEWTWVSAGGGISIPVVMLQHDHLSGGVW